MLLFHSQRPWLYTLLVHGGEGRGVSFSSVRKCLLSALLHVGLGTIQGNPKGCTVPEGCAIGKIRCFAQLKKCSRRPLNHVH